MRVLCYGDAAGLENSESNVVSGKIGDRSVVSTTVAVKFCDDDRIYVDDEWYNVQSVAVNDVFDVDTRLFEPSRIAELY